MVRVGLEEYRGSTWGWGGIAWGCMGGNGVLRGAGESRGEGDGVPTPVQGMGGVSTEVPECCWAALGWERGATGGLGSRQAGVGVRHLC